LPRAHGVADKLEETKAEVCLGHETVLMVEDEPLVREFTHRTLRDLGYTVLLAANGTDALAIAAAHREEIHLLLTDVIMPQLSGKLLAEHLQRTRPNLRVLYISGYTDNTILHQGILEPEVAFLQKPFTPGTLALKVREVLGE